MNDPKETSKSTDESLRDQGYSRDKDDSNKYWRQKETGGWETVRTDGDHSQREGQQSWDKH